MSNKYFGSPSFWLVLVVLVIMPAVSIYFMSKGTSLHKDLVAQLNDFGSFNVQGLETSNKKISIVHFQASNNSNYEYQKSRVHEAYYDDSNIQLLTILKDGVELSDTLPFEKVFNGESVDFNSGLQGIAKDVPIDQHFILIDTNSHIRNSYSIQDSSEVNRMIAHILKIRPIKKKATFLPLNKKEK